VTKIILSMNIHSHVNKRPRLVPIPSKVNQVNTIQFYLSKINFIYPPLRFGLPSGLFLFAFPTNIIYAFLFFIHLYYIPRLFHHPRLEHSNLSTSYKAPRYVFCSILTILHFSSAPCSKATSAYLPPLISETKFHAHTKP
jgi:hypothetical protein